MLVSIKPECPPLNAEWKIHIDGATHTTNPSAIGAGGFTVWANDMLYHAEASQMIEASNNRAEMFALSKALQWATKRDMPQVDIYTDSDIVYKWANGLSTLRNPGMIRLANICSKLGEVMPFRVTWVGRGEERQAFTDYIAKLGLHQDIVLSTAKQHALILGGYYA